MKKHAKKLMLSRETLRELVELKNVRGATGWSWSCGLTTCGGPENPCMDQVASERNC
jgi:hypothetical protein